MFDLETFFLALQAVGAIGTLFIAVMAFNRWKPELFGKAKFELYQTICTYYLKFPFFMSDYLLFPKTTYQSHSPEEQIVWLKHYEHQDMRGLKYSEIAFEVDKQKRKIYELLMAEKMLNEDNLDGNFEIKNYSVWKFIYTLDEKLKDLVRSDADKFIKLEEDLINYYNTQSDDVRRECHNKFNVYRKKLKEIK